MAENNKSQFIKREEIKFWIAIISIIVGGAVCFTKLEAKVSAMDDDIVENKQEYEKAIIRIDENLNTLTENQNQIKLDITAIQKDIEFIRENLE